MPTFRSRPPFVRVATSAIHGAGVFAAKDIEPLDVVLEVDDARLGERRTGGASELADAPERYINHSCEPNGFIKAVDGVHYVFALRDILASEEVTIDYAVNRDSADHVVVPCHCGSEYCRGDIQLGYFDLSPTLQIAYLPLLEEWFIKRHSERISELCQSGLTA